MKAKKVIRTIAFSLAGVLMFGSMNVFASEVDVIPESTSEEYEMANDMPITIDPNMEIKQQTPVELTDFPSLFSVDEHGYRAGNSLNLQEAEIIGGPTTYAVVAGRAQDYLTQTGELKVLPLTINPGVYLQAQLTQPAYSNIDYDLYILDAEGNIILGSENYTKINGTSGTLPESVGYITQGTDAADYYLAVRSSNGGSANEVFTLDYSVSNAYDQLEPSENAANALPFTFGINGAQISVTNLSSPVDNDWYVIDVLSDRNYDNLILNIATPSGNTCRYEVYQNVNSAGYEMSKIASNTGKMTVPVSTGKYYIRICNEKTLENYDENDIQNYTFSVMPKLRADGIIVTEYNGNEGANFYVKYPGFSKKMFRTKDWISVTGYVTTRDKETNEVYGVGDYSVTAMYGNPYWEANNTPNYAIRTGVATSDSSGKYSIRISLPPAMGAQTWNAGLTTQYFDVCNIKTGLTNQASIFYNEEFVHYKYSLYN